jgi:Glycosyl transferase family 2
VSELARPALSVVLPTTSDFASVATTVRYLRRQTIADRLEVVFVAMACPDFVVGPEARDGFHDVRVVLTGRRSHGHACAEGVRAARADVVAFAEDHCFPEPGWAEALLAAYGSPEIVAVGPVFRNANPGTLVSWCDFVIGYGPWIDPRGGGDRPFLAGHNSSYQRDVLLGLGDALPDALESETVLHLMLRSQGKRLVLEPRARAAHTNFGLFGVWLPLMYHSGRVFASERARGWSWPRRVFYAAASPLIPCVRLLRATRHLRSSPEHRPSLLTLMPLLTIGLGADGLGQMIGYTLGSGGSPRHLSAFECRRVDFVPESDRNLWEANAGV